MEVRIRPGRREDIPQVLALVRELAAFERAPEAVTNTEARMAEDGFGPAPAFRLLVAETTEDGVATLAGMAVFFVKYSTWKGRGLFLDDLVVTERYRRQGVGGKLFDALLRIAAGEGMQTMHWQVLDWNAPAMAFYRTYGAHFDGSWVDCKLTEEQIRGFHAGPNRRG